MVNYRPDFKRKYTFSLNGLWNFCFDEDHDNFNDKIHGNFTDYQINVPFVYQSELSGINDTTYHKSIWYSKEMIFTKEQLEGSIIVKFGAIDSTAYIYVNGQLVDIHHGGYSQIDCEISKYLFEGKNTMVVNAIDDRKKNKPRGKQYWKDEPDRCWYTETSGIHKNTYIEFTGKEYIKSFHLIPDIDTQNVGLQAYLNEEFTGSLKVDISYEGKVVKSYVISLNDEYYINETFNLKPEDYIDNVHYWSIDNPNLYDICLTLLKDDKQCDQVKSYFGFRKIETKGKYIYLNRLPIYQRLVLDQGYWKESLTTPPSEEAIVKDLELIKAMGFNGVRMHQKCEDPLFYYHADRLGLLVWLEMPSSYEFNSEAVHNNLVEWEAIIKQNWNHPSIICYVPINESWGVRDIADNVDEQNFADTMYKLTKTLDPSRLISTNDGWEFGGISDIYGYHEYFANPKQFSIEFKCFDEVAKKGMWNRQLEVKDKPLEDKPIMLSEFGGIAISSDANSWGYNKDAKDKNEFKDLLTKHVDAALSLEYSAGYCYTQLSDVMQEVNGLLNYDRSPKLSIKEYRQIFYKNPYNYHNK